MEDVQDSLSLLLREGNALGHNNALNALLEVGEKRPLLQSQCLKGLVYAQERKPPEVFGCNPQERGRVQIRHVLSDEAVCEAVEDGTKQHLHDFVLGLVFGGQVQHLQDNTSHK